MKKLFLGLVIPFLWIAVAAHALPVFPGAEGFGTGTVAGRGGTVYRVDTLEDNTNTPVLNGDGTYSSSLRAAVNASGARTIVFEVSGYIYLSSNITISSPYITIAGQTAPSPGICLRGGGFYIQTHDVLIQHLAMRNPYDGCEIWGVSYNIVIDHCSFTWATDENSGTWYDGATDFTYSNNLIAEGLMGHSMGTLLGSGFSRGTVIKNVYAHNKERNPRVQRGWSEDAYLIMINNLIYNNWWDCASVGGGYGESLPVHINGVNNVVLDGPESLAGEALYGFDSGSGYTLYTSGDEHYPYQGSSPTGLIYTGSVQIITSPDYDLGGYTILDAADVESTLLENVGSRPADRDPTDTRILNTITNDNGQWVSSPPSWTTMENNTADFPLPSNPSADDDEDGYTNLEELLHEYLETVQGEGSVPPIPPEDPPAPFQNSTNFSEYGSGTKPGNWNDYGPPGSWTIDIEAGTIGGKVLSHDDAISARYVLLWEQPAVIEDEVQIMSQVRVNGAGTDTGPGAGRIVVCGGGSAENESGYFLGIRSNLDGCIGLAKYVDGAYTNLISSCGHSFIEAGEWVWLYLDFDPDTGNLKGYVWDDGGTKPGSPNVSASDSSLTSGKVGVSDWSADSKADYGFFSVGSGGLAAPEPPPEEGQGSWDHSVAAQGSFCIQ